MAQNFWTAIDAWTVCFVVTIVVSLMTRPRDERELAGLVLLADRTSARRAAAVVPAAWPFSASWCWRRRCLLNVVFF